MTRIVIVACGLALAVPAVAAAQNRDQQQLLAELRVAQEQTQQLRLAVNTLTDAIKDLTKTTNTKLDDQANSTRKGFADQKVLIDSLTENARQLREKVDDANVRTSAIGQDVQSIVKNLYSLQAQMAPLAALIPAAAPPDASQPQTGSVPPPLSAPSPSSPEVSSNKTFQMAQADYIGGHYDIAITGLQGYLRSCPNCPNSADAQYYIGESLFALGKSQEAAAAYGLVIENFKGSAKEPDAYYRRGVAFENLGQKDRARADFQYVVSHFKDSNVYTSAQSGLLRVK